MSSSSPSDAVDPVVVLLDGLIADVHLDELHDRVGVCFGYGSKLDARVLLDLAALTFLACGASSADPLKFDELERRYLPDSTVRGNTAHQKRRYALTARRAHIEAFARDMEAHGRARATVARRLGTITCFYRYAEQEGLIEHSPAVHVRRPKMDYESHAIGLDRNEIGAMLVAAGLAGARDHALISLLALNGLRVSEAIGARIENLALERGHRTLTVLRKGGKTVTMPLAPRTARAIDLVVGERFEGTILYGNDGARLDRHAAARIVRRIAKAAGINKQIGPHTLPHGFITAALDAGVPLRDVQEAASHADPRTTMRYDRARVSLDRHATYIVSTFIAGAAR